MSERREGRGESLQEREQRTAPDDTGPHGRTGRTELVVDESMSGARLDVLLGHLVPLSLRARRRLVGDGLVLLNGRRARAGDRPGTGDRLCLCTPPGAASPCADEGTAGPEDRTGSHACRLLHRTENLAFFAKPALVHTVSLAGRSNHSLEEAARRLLEADPGGLPAHFELLQRLDYGTSGLVAAALSEERARAFRREEDEGLVVKKYACLLEGGLDGACRARARLVSAGRGRMRAMADDNPDPLRWTDFVPLACGSWQDFFGDTEPSPLPAGLRLTLTGCLLHKGARHQIRAHAAGMHLPLAGDSLYGATPLPQGNFFLHHGALDIRGAGTRLLPDWRLQPGMLGLVEQWLQIP